MLVKGLLLQCKRMRMYGSAKRPHYPELRGRGEEQAKDMLGITPASFFLLYNFGSQRQLLDWSSIPAATICPRNGDFPIPPGKVSLIGSNCPIWKESGGGMWDMGIAVLPAARVLSLSASAAAAGTKLTTDASRILRGCIPFGVFTVDFFASCFVGDPREEVVRLVTLPRLREKMFPVTGLPARTGFEGFAIRHYVDIEVSHGDRSPRERRGRGCGFVNDRDVVHAFVAYLRDHGHPDLRVDRRPDDDNRGSSDIDAIAGAFAIEHTSADTLPNQRRDSDWFMRAAGGLEQELPTAPPFRLNITLEYHAVGKGQNWPAIREALKTWITQEAPLLADGTHKIEDVAGVPFRLHVTKASGRRPGVFFARYAPDDDTLSDRIRAQFDRKAEKLAKYQSSDRTTVLLVENDDIALMDEGKMLDAIRRAYPSGSPTGVDQIWYADTSIPRAIEFRDFTAELRERRPTSGCS